MARSRRGNFAVSLSFTFPVFKLLLYVVFDAAPSDKDTELFVLSTTKASSVVVLRMLSKQLQLRIFIKVRYSLMNAFSVYQLILIKSISGCPITFQSLIIYHQMKNSLTLVCSRSSQMTESAGGKVCLCILAVFFPPIAVAIHTGCGAEACLNWLFTFLFWIPGVIHAWVVILRKPHPHHHDVIIVQQPAAVVAAAPAAAAPSVVLNQTTVHHTGQYQPQYYQQPNQYPAQPQQYQQGYPPQQGHPGQPEQKGNAPPQYY
uniref:Uncharacterized protein n=1 Tax=Pristionchus pacificus TaxID=54126 RepID=A0A2A6BGM7_PRIPA|eukprot:PDM65029.1 hypothetical protein PRIPAC_53285 [Pristionchus pacificus]